MADEDDPTLTESGKLKRKILRDEAKRKALMAALLGGGAYGSYRLGKWFLPDESRRLLGATGNRYHELMRSRTLSGQSNELDNRVIGSYADLASKLAVTPVAGMQGKDLVRTIRTSLPVGNPWRPFWSDAHYDAFGRGPAYGGAQLIDEHAADMTHQGNGSPKLLKYLADKFTPSFGDKINDIAKEENGGKGLFGGHNLRESLAYEKDTAGQGVQGKILERILTDSDLNSPNRNLFGRKKEDGLGSATMAVKRDLSDALLNSSFPNYLKIGQYANGIRNTLSGLLPAVLGTGAVAAAGAGLYKAVKSTKRTKEEERRLKRKAEEEEAAAEKSANMFSPANLLARARKETNTNPTPAQQEAGNYAKGRVTLHGLKIAIENPKGSVRSGVSDSGKKWSTRMRADYGYFVGTEAIDGDAVDCFIGPDHDSELVVAVDQVIGGKFDETKFILGCKSRDAAEKCYLQHYDKDWKLGPTATLTVSQLKTWLKSGDTKKPFVGQLVKAALDYTKRLESLRLRRGECIHCGTPDQDPHPPCECQTKDAQKC